MEWRVGKVISNERIAADMYSLHVELPNWEGHRAGQSCDIRLRAANGYEAVRAFSVATAPKPGTAIEFGIQLIPGGEVSPYLCSLKPGGEIEILGPIGGHFVWDATDARPVILIGGGSGIVPLMSIARHHRAIKTDIPLTLLMSAKTYAHVPWREELIAYQNPKVHVRIAVTREASAKAHYDKRFNKEILKSEIGEFIGKNPRIYVCGHDEFVSGISDTLMEIGFLAPEILTERFGA